MDIKDVKIIINSINDITAIKATIDGEDHLTGDVRHIDLKSGIATGVFSNITYMESDEFLKSWYNTIEECVKYKISKSIDSINSELVDNRFNLFFIEFKFDSKV